MSLMPAGTLTRITYGPRSFGSPTSTASCTCAGNAANGIHAMSSGRIDPKFVGDKPRGMELITPSRSSTFHRESAGRDEGDPVPRIHFAPEMRRRFSEHHFKRRPHMCLQEMTAPGAGVVLRH